MHCCPNGTAVLNRCGYGLRKKPKSWRHGTRTCNQKNVNCKFDNCQNSHCGMLFLQYLLNSGPGIFVSHRTVIVVKQAVLQ